MSEFDGGTGRFGTRGRIVEPAKDHLAAGGLEDAGDGDFDGTTDGASSMIDDDHGAVIEIADTLVVLLALFQDHDLHFFARQKDGAKSVGKIVDVEHLDVVNLGDFVEVEVIGDDARIPFAGQLQQLEIDLADGRKIVGDNLHLKAGNRLHTLEYVESAAAPLTARGIRGVGDQLQLMQNKLRNHEQAVEKTCLGDVCDAPVDDDGSIENADGCARCFFSGEEMAQRGRIKAIALVSADEQAEISHEQQDEELDGGSGGSGRDGGAQYERDEQGSDDPEDSAEDRTEKSMKSKSANTKLDEDDGNCGSGTQRGGRQSGDPKWMQEGTERRDQGKKENP